MCWRWLHNVLETKCTKSCHFLFYRSWLHNKSFIWSENAPLEENEQKEMGNSIVETTKEVLLLENFQKFSLNKQLLVLLKVGIHCLSLSDYLRSLNCWEKFIKKFPRSWQNFSKLNSTQALDRHQKNWRKILQPRFELAFAEINWTGSHTFYSLKKVFTLTSP